jgi:hypothetical protein
MEHILYSSKKNRQENMKKYFLPLLMVFLIFSHGSFANEVGKVCAASKMPADKNFIGLGTHAVTDDRYFNLLSELPMEWIRVEFHWKYIEKEPGIYNWETYDYIFIELLRRNKKILAIINHPPEWALENEENFLNRFNQFTSLLVKRYMPKGYISTSKKIDGGVSYWEIFNEPNLPGYGWPFKNLSEKDNVNLYAKTLTVANQSIRDIDTGAFILNGGLSPDGTHPKIFLSELLKKLDHDCFDIFAYHPYGPIENIPNIYKEAKALLNHHGVKKAVWFTEYGANNDKDRSRMLKKLYQMFKQQKIDALFWFSLRDLKFWGWNFGLVEYDWTPKPHFQEFKELFEKQKK